MFIFKKNVRTITDADGCQVLNDMVGDKRLVLKCCVCVRIFQHVLNNLTGMRQQIILQLVSSQQLWCYMVYTEMESCGNKPFFG